jgi:hypothetical protein
MTDAAHLQGQNFKPKSLLTVRCALHRCCAFLALKGPNQVVFRGNEALVSVTPFGSPAFNYEWRSNNVVIALGATGNLIIANTSPAALTNYVVIIANAYGIYPLNLSNLRISNPGNYPTHWLPQMQTTTESPSTHKFGFNISWASGQTVVVEASTNLANPDWQPVQTNTLTTGSANFSDPQWTNYPNRFYRLRSPQ